MFLKSSLKSALRDTTISTSTPAPLPRSESLVMRAMRPDSEHVGPATHQKNFFVADMTDQFAAVGKLHQFNAARQIGTARRRLTFSHFRLPWWFARRRTLVCRLWKFSTFTAISGSSETQY
jgi:hypothetical protein